VIQFSSMNIPSFDPERNYLVYILDMLEAIEHIERYVGGMSEVQFSQNQVVQDAVVHRVQIIGEAAGKMPKEIREKFPDTQWQRIVAMRNLIIHDYAHVDEGEVWRVVQTDLPVLKPQLQIIKLFLEKK
jgi:uncharacterized protein with HEPN domain